MTACIRTGAALSGLVAIVTFASVTGAVEQPTMGLRPGGRDGWMKLSR